MLRKPLTLTPVESTLVPKTKAPLNQRSTIRFCLALAFSVAAAIGSSAQAVFKPLVSFRDDGSTGIAAVGQLVQGTDGNFYGAASAGSYGNTGTIFQITPGGTLKVIYRFCYQSCTTYPHGSNPNPLVLGSDGNFYGTTENGGANNEGTFFRITAKGALTTLYSFCGLKNCADGANPIGSLIQGKDGDFYGITAQGGTSDVQYCTETVLGCGTAFKITPTGGLTILYSFCSTTGCSDGPTPTPALVQSKDGNFYGTTANGGSALSGTVFKLASTGTLTTLYTFAYCNSVDCQNGQYPETGLIQGVDGNFYGTTLNGGVEDDAGTVFKITSKGALTTLYSFCHPGCADGTRPGGLVQGNDGDFYGTTEGGGAHAQGVIFKITSDGTFATIYSFCAEANCADGGQPFETLVQGTDGKLYGTTLMGGASNVGTVFSLDNGLAPFIKTVPTSHKVGSKVTILGSNLAGATSVRFNGTEATFTAPSSTYLSASVPVGATTGPVTVKTPSGTLTSNTAFLVPPLFAQFDPPSGAAGTMVTITGVSFTQTTAVTFQGGKAASFNVVSDTEITATVPTGAITGKIDVTTLGGITVSPTSFTVTAP